jgi:Na+/H+ antiporter NhaD/arsenite permease-like protein
MSNAELGEIYFIAGMMFLILVLCVIATYAFFKTFYKEKAMREKEQAEKKKQEIQKKKSKTKN